MQLRIGVALGWLRVGEGLAQRAVGEVGPLREALAYPEPPQRYTDAQLHRALDDALLPALKDQLDHADAWSQKLSGGEQQRLAIARVLLKQPRWVFADEATSALDAQAENFVYKRLLALVESAQGALVSIAHRPAVATFHNRFWTLQPQPEGAPTRYQVADSQKSE